MRIEDSMSHEQELRHRTIIERDRLRAIHQAQLDLASTLDMNNPIERAVAIALMIGESNGSLDLDVQRAREAIAKAHGHSGCGLPPTGDGKDNTVPPELQCGGTVYDSSGTPSICHRAPGDHLHGPVGGCRAGAHNHHPWRPAA
jgi:hypothetical protein